MAKQNESDHPKIIESVGGLIAIDETLDQTGLNPPSELKLNALQTSRETANERQSSFGNSRADRQTVGLERAVDIDKFDLVAAEPRAFVEATQTKHDHSLNSIAKFSNGRRERNKFFYLNDHSICELARQFKALVVGAYSFKIPEYKAVNAIPFHRPRL